MQDPVSNYPKQKDFGSKTQVVEHLPAKYKYQKKKKKKKVIFFFSLNSSVGSTQYYQPNHILVDFFFCGTR
jgi:hypothetical protein